jgi:hypothetical protein
VPKVGEPKAKKKQSRKHEKDLGLGKPYLSQRAQRKD